MKQLLVYFSILSATACAQPKPAYNSPPHYDLNKPVKYAMPKELEEISGIAFYKGDSSVLYAEQDEEGKVYRLHLGDTKADHFSFGRHGDYEDIALTDNTAFLLRSDGVLFSFPLDGTNMIANNVHEWKNILPSGEYEAMYADAANDLLYILCKNCTADKNNKTASGYIFRIKENDSIVLSGTFMLSAKQIAGKTGKKKIAFRPSALTKNVLTNEWYILSSVNKMLVVADKNFQVKAVYHLDPKLFVQPEGITFDSNHNLYISNEGAHIQSGTVFKFPYRR